MPSNKGKSRYVQRPPTSHPRHQRTSLQNTVTPQQHLLDETSSRLASPGSALTNEANKPAALLRRNSSSESHATGQSDPKQWFDQSNQNPTASFDNNDMEVDAPFFQKELGSPYGNNPYPHGLTNPPQHSTAQSSSAEDYRSVIDDLTIEIQRLKEELKRYKQPGPDMLRNEKLFEIKVHGLPNKKRRELETTLRDFAASLEGSSGSSSQKKKSSRHKDRDQPSSGSRSLSKHPSSSSGSNARPADSAYASMSIGAKSSGTSLGHGMVHSKDANEKKVHNYLRDIPEGLYPRHMVMTDKQRKKLVVRRLEQLFTGKIGGRQLEKKHVRAQDNNPSQAPDSNDSQRQAPAIPQTSRQESNEPSREAKFHPMEHQSGHSGKKSGSRDNESTSNSHGEGTESGGNGNVSSGSANPSLPAPQLREQRPTRPRDLDPDRAQIPSENMDYIRHLGLAPAKSLEHQPDPLEAFRPDEEGWVYLNLLCNLAQLHIINVTPDFVRVAVSEMSTKFQLSSDGCKIRWKGGVDGTKFSSDSSGYNSQKSPSTDDSDNTKHQSHKRQKPGSQVGDSYRSGGKNGVKFGQVSTSSKSFHYKPIFARHDSSPGQTSMEDTPSSFGPPEDSNVGDSRWGMSGSGTSNRKKRRRGGAIIYYSGAPFCTDLSGDPGELSSPSRLPSSSQNTGESEQVVLPYPLLRRTSSGSSINFKPLSDWRNTSSPVSAMDIDNGSPVLESSTDEIETLSEVALDLVWSDEAQSTGLPPLEPCGLGGVLPDDHFMVMVKTLRPKEDITPDRKSRYARSEETAESISRRLATMSTSSPDLRAFRALPHIESQFTEIEYLSGGIKRFAPVPLPPPVIFFPPFSTDESSAGDIFASEDMLDTELSEESSSRRANPHLSDDYPDGVDLTSGDEEGYDPDDSPNDQNMYDADDGTQIPHSREQTNTPQRSSSAAAAAGTVGYGSKSTTAEPILPADDSSAATAGVARSAYKSSEDEDEDEDEDD